MNAPGNATIALRKALARFRASTAAVADLNSRAEAFQARAEELRQSSGHKRHAATEAHALALLAGEAPDGQTEDDPGAEGLREANASERAALHLQDKRPALAAKHREAQAVVTDAALALYCLDRDAALADSRKALGALATGLARMIAADLVRNRIVGERFTFDATRHPPAELWSGSHQARAFLSAIPARFGGEGLAAQVEVEATRISAATFQTLEVIHE